MKKKLIKLKDVSETSFVLIGISSHENDYRLSWAINNHLEINFKRTENYILKDIKKNIIKNFSQYEYNDEEALVKQLLISNKCENGYLLTEFKNMDFFIVLLGELHQDYINNFLNKLKNVNIISIATQIDVSSLKSKNYLNFNI